MVENSIKHGLSKQVGSIDIMICSIISALRVRIIVSDNGGGFMTVPNCDSPDHGYGLKNVHERLTMMFGRKNICMRCFNNNGASIELTFPRHEAICTIPQS